MSTTNDEVDLSKARLLITDSVGVYLPQRFAESIQHNAVKGVSDEDWKVLLSGPTHEHYWDAWADVCDNASIEEDGVLYHLHQDGDLWLVPTEQEAEKPVAKEIRRFGHTFKPMSGNDWDGFAGADEGSFICYTDDAVLILSPDEKNLSVFNQDGMESMYVLECVFN